MPPLDDRRRNQRHALADRIHRNNVQTLALVRRQLPEIRSQQIRKRRRSIDALIPSQKRLLDRGLHNRRTHHRNRQARAVFVNQRLRQALGQRVSIRPAQFVRALASLLRSGSFAASASGSCESDSPARRLAGLWPHVLSANACWRSSSVTSALSAFAPRSVSPTRAASATPVRIKFGDSSRACNSAAVFRSLGRRAFPPRSRWKDAASRRDPTCAQTPQRCTAASTLVDSASRRSGLKSVSPELLMIRSRFFRKRSETSGASPSSGCETSPSTTSTRSRRNRANPAP